MRSLVLIVSPLVSLVIGPLIVFASSPADGNGPLLVVSGWGHDGLRLVAEAGGQIYGPVRAPLGVLAFSADPAFADTLRAAGAWAVLDGSKIAALCGAEQ